MFVGSAIGGYAPMLWGDSGFSFTAIVLTAVGGILGVWVGFRISE